jgi:hypothetical protein
VKSPYLAAGCGDLVDVLEDSEEPDDETDEDESLEDVDEDESLDEVDEDESLEEVDPDDELLSAAGLRLSLR